MSTTALNKVLKSPLTCPLGIEATGIRFVRMFLPFSRAYASVIPIRAKGGSIKIE